MKEFGDIYSEKIIPIFIGFSKNYIQHNFKTGIKKYRNIMEHRNTTEERTIDELIKEHQEFKEQCLQSDVKNFEINHKYDKEIQKVYDYIDAEKDRIDSM